MKNLVKFSTSIATKGLVAAVAIGMSLSVAVAAEWKMSTSYKPDSDAHAGALAFAKLVEEKSNGNITIKVFPANQLGDWTEVYEQVTAGAVEITMGAVPATFDKRLAIDSSPYAVATYAEAEKAYSPGGYIYEIVSDLVAEQGVTILGTWPLGMGGAAFTKELPDATNPNAKQGLKVRVWPGGITHRALMERLGFNVAFIPWDEVYTALQTGVADGVIGGNPELVLTYFKDVTKTYVQYNDHFENHYFMANKELIDGLSDEDRKAVQDAAKEIMDEQFPKAEEIDNLNMQKMTDLGINVVKFDDATAKAFAKVTREDVWPLVTDEIGDEIYGIMKKELGLE